MLSLRLLAARLPAVVLDAALAVVVAFGSIGLDAVDPDNRIGALPVLWDVLLAAPLVLRRRAPALAASAIGLICLVQWVIGQPADADFVVLVMLYTLGVHDGRRWVLALAATTAEAGVVMAVTKWAPPSHQWLMGLTATGTVTGAWLLGVYIRMRRAYIASVVARAESAERDRDAQAKIAVEAERARIAREMHDVIAHSLSVMITLTDVATIADPQTSQTAAAQASDVGREAMTEMHRLLAVLRPGTPADLTPQPGIDQLPDLAATTRAAGIPVRICLRGDIAGTPSAAGLSVYRIVQEGLTNIRKHGRNVTDVQISIVDDDGWITVTIDNDGDHIGDRTGSGGRRSDKNNEDGYGLAGMRERVNLYGGELVAGPHTGGGWHLKARLLVGERHLEHAAVGGA